MTYTLTDEPSAMDLGKTSKVSCLNNSLGYECDIMKLHSIYNPVKAPSTTS